LPAADAEVAALGAHAAAPVALASAQVAASAIAAPAQTACSWTLHRDAYLGECVGGECGTYGLAEAERLCLEHHEECAGVTCEGADAATDAASACSLRMGEPFLEFSPSAEASYTSECLPRAQQQAQPAEGAPPAGDQGAASPVQADSNAGGIMGSNEAPAPLNRGVLPLGRLAIVVVAHNKPDELTACLQALASLEGIRETPVAVSLDDPPSFSHMEAVVRSMAGRMRIDIWRKTTIPVRKASVAKISEHFRFVLTEAFDRRRFEYVVFLENDLVVAPDFLWLFRSTAWLLEEDPTLFCVSAWNDNGVAGQVSDERRLFRTDYFPGLGWMIRSETWRQIRDAWPEFPSTGWDHWLRHGSGLHPRECIAPEVSRTHHLAVKAGTNVRRGTPAAKRLQSMPVSHLAPGKLGDLAYLLPDNYDAELRARVRSARRVTADDVPSLAAGQEYVLPYSREDYAPLAKAFLLAPAQPRTAHRGLIITRHPPSGAVVFMVDRRLGEQLLPDQDVWKPSPRRVVQAALPGQSCDQHCGGAGLRCDERELEFVSSCRYLREAFPCESGCGHQVGDELPAYVHDAKRDTARQCLVTDDKVPTCKASSPATTRLCACVP